MVGLSGVGGMPPPRMQPPSFDTLDSDGSGGISLDEFESAGKSGKTGASSSSDTSRAEELFKSIDSDGDGSLSKSELDSFNSKIEQQMQSLGFLAQQSQGMAPPGSSDWFGQADTNSHGSISASEFSTVSSSQTDMTSDQIDSLFNTIDTDQDGSISQDESQAWADSMQKNGPPPGPPPGQKQSDDSSLSASLLSLAQNSYQSASQLSASSLSSWLSAA